MKTIRMYFILIVLYFTNSSLYIKQEVNSHLIFKIEHFNKNYPEYSAEIYLIIELDKFLDLKNYSIKIGDSSSNLSYFITSNGGLFLSYPSIDIYNFGCCEYKNIEKFIHKLYSKELDSNIFLNCENNYNNSDYILNKKYAKNLNLKFNEERYVITIWLAEIDFCVCPIYMESPQQPIFGINGAYLRKIKKLKEPSKSILKEIKNIIKEILKKNR